jgi:hypothetical protein
LLLRQITHGASVIHPMNLEQGMPCKYSNN